MNNIGTTKDNLLLRMNDAGFDNVIHIDLKGVYNYTRYVTGIMIEQKPGAIVNMVSVAGLCGNTG